MGVRCWVLGMGLCRAAGLDCFAMGGDLDDHITSVSVNTAPTPHSSPTRQLLHAAVHQSILYIYLQEE